MRTIVTTRAQLDDMKEKLSRAHRVVWDTETFKTNNWSQRKLMGTAFTVEKGVDWESWYIPTGHQNHPDLPPAYNVPLDWLLELPWDDPDKLWIAHNAKFDLNIMRNVGISIAGSVFDTQVTMHLLDENRFSYELDGLGRDLFGERKEDLKKLEKQWGWEGIPVGIMANYAMQDTELTYRLFNYCHTKMTMTGLYEKPVWNTTRRAVHTLDRMVANGILMDRDELARLSQQAEERMGEIETALGFSPTKATQIKKLLFEDLKLPVLARQPKSKEPLIDKPTLLRIQAHVTDRPEVVELLDQIIEYRTVQKAKSTWYDGFRNHLDDTNRIHPGLKQHGTATGRPSCSNPNTLQIPRDATKSPVKKCFRAPAGYQLWELDYSQIELRLGAHYAKEQRMVEAYVNGDDLHHLTAELIDSYSYFANKSEGRQIGKTGNFLWIYRGGAGRLKESLWIQARMDVSLELCREWTEGFHRTYPGFKRINAYCEKKARENGAINYFNGRRRRFPYYGQEAAFNSLIQGGASQIMWMALNEIDEATQKGEIDIQLCNTVYDSIWLYVPTATADETLTRVCELMVADPTQRFGMPFVADRKLMADDPAKS